MTTFPFSPSPLQNATFNPVLGGQTYVATITWNVYGQRWYLNLSDSNGNPVITTAVVASQDPQGISAITWAENVVTVTTADPHWLPVGSKAILYLSGNTPDAYNGLYTVNVTGPSSFTYALDGDPGLNTVAGVFGGVVDLSAGLVPGSMLLFYEGTMQFATTP
jgi:hypothetical protein